MADNLKATWQPTISRMGKRLTVRLDDELDAIIEQACIDGNCDKASAVRDAIRKGFGVTVTQESAKESKGDTAPSKSEPYDVWNTTNGCCNRYRANGELMFHFKPSEIMDGIQYYRDTQDPNSMIKWSHSKERGWTPRVTLR